MSVAHRMEEMPSLSELVSAPAVDAPIPRSVPPMAEPERDRRYFEMDDSADMMGFPLNPKMLVGLQVEFVGPGEEPRVATRSAQLLVDPFHPKYLLTTAGLRLRF